MVLKELLTELCGEQTTRGTKIPRGAQRQGNNKLCELSETLVAFVTRPKIG